MRVIDPSGKNPTIDYSGVRVPIAYDRRQPRIILRMVMEDLGLEPSSQFQMLKSKPWADLKPLKVHTKDDQYRAMMTVSPATFILWINQVARVAPDRKPLLEQYQTSIAQTLVRYAAHAFPRKAA